MWERTEITAQPIKCDECGETMEAMWEQIEDGRKRSTVFHCRHCGADRELIREYDDQGKEEKSCIRRYFFG